MRWPNAPGTYALVLANEAPLEIRVGGLGAQAFPPGRYIYAGSALGPGGLRARIGRHLRPADGKRPHWHIDWLAAAMAVVAVYAVPGSDRAECMLVRSLCALPASSVPVRGLGSSDCRAGCPAHLVRLPDGFDLDELEVVLWFRSGGRI